MARYKTQLKWQERANGEITISDLSGKLVGYVKRYEYGRGWWFTPLTEAMQAKVEMTKKPNHWLVDKYMGGHDHELAARPSVLFDTKQKVEAFILGGYDSAEVIAWRKITKALKAQEYIQ